MRDDSERGEYFQHKMILKAQRSGRGTLRVNASHQRYCQMLWMARSGGVLLNHQSILELLSIY